MVEERDRGDGVEDDDMRCRYKFHLVTPWMTITTERREMIIMTMAKEATINDEKKQSDTFHRAVIELS